MKWSLVGGLLLAAVLGAVGTYIFVVFIGTAMPTAEHFALAKTVTIKDVENDYTFTMSCIWAGKPSAAYALQTYEFVPGQKYYRSDWVGRRNDDLEVVMTIWGPGTEGDDYIVEIAKSSMHSISIELPDGQTHTFPSGSGEGYWATVISF